MSSKLTRTLTGTLVVALTAAVGVQSFYVYRLHEKLDRPTPAQEQQARVDERSDPSALDDPSTDPLGQAFDTRDWDPFREMEHMRSRIDEIFADSMGRFDLDSSFPELSMPRADLTEDDEQYIVRLDVPGSDAESFEVSLEGRSLKIEGDRAEEIQEEGPGDFVRRERHVGHFERLLALPGPVDSETLITDYSDGVLTVRVHKA